MGGPSPAGSSSPALIEIIGPAGSGKSTLVQTLCRHGGCGIAASPPDPRAVENLGFYARYILETLPVLARMGLPTTPDGRLYRQPVASVVIAKGWSDMLARQKKRTDGLILLDQGPVYTLAELHRRGPVRLLRQTGWWDAMYARWAAVLDCVVCLDADDAILIPRVHAREKRHRIKHMTESDARRDLSRWRASLGYVLAHLVHRSPQLRVLRYDTSSRTPDALADLLLEDLGTRSTAPSDSPWR